MTVSPNNSWFQSDVNIVLGQLNKWFKANLLSLNFDKTSFSQFTIKNTRTSDKNLSMKINTFVQLLKQNFWSYLITIISFGKYTLNLLSLN